MKRGFSARGGLGLPQEPGELIHSLAGKTKCVLTCWVDVEEGAGLLESSIVSETESKAHHK